MIRKHIPFFGIVCLLLSVFSQQLFCQEKTVTLGGPDGWKPFSRSFGVTIGKGRFGYDAVVLDTSSAKADSSTDLLLSFETPIPNDAAGNYTVLSSNFTTSPNAMMGNYAALSMGSTSGLRLKGSQNSIFGSKGYTGSLSMEFWLYPSIAENGEQIFSWRSSINQDHYAIYQSILASIFNNKIEWKFDNVFKSPDNTFSNVILTSYSSIIPGKWSHHCIAYNDETGLIEYRINGRVEAVQFITASGHEYGDIYTLQLGVPSSIEICGRFTGLIDDFLISRTYHEGQPFYGKYSIDPARFETQPLKTSSRYSTLTRLTAEYTVPGETGVAFFVRGGDNFYQWTDTYPEWIPVTNGSTIEDVSGLYFQVAAELYASGTGTHSPSITSITLSYVEDALPLPPARVSAVGENGAVQISWSTSVDFDTTGYVVYYGERPGEYTKKINAGKNLSLRVDNLVNGKIYYFAVVAYDSFGPDQSGELSKEVYARPLLTKDIKNE